MSAKAEVAEAAASATKPSKLENLTKKLEILQRQIAEEEGKRKAQNRKEDTRLKVIIGAAIIANTTANPDTRPEVVAVLKKAITAPRDREFLASKGWL